MRISRFGTLFALLGACLVSGNVASAAPIYVGQWHVGDGPVWTSNPAVLNAQETAALLFGGTPLGYVISTVSSDPSAINFMAYVDGWADDQFLFTPVAQNFKLDLGNPGYDDPSGFATAYSAYVLDHSCFNRYDAPSEVCAAAEPGVNYAFLADDLAPVPEPGTLLLLGTTAAGLGLTRWREARRRRQET